MNEGHPHSSCCTASDSLGTPCPRMGHCRMVAPRHHCWCTGVQPQHCSTWQPRCCHPVVVWCSLTLGLGHEGSSDRCWRTLAAAAAGKPGRLCCYQVTILWCLWCLCCDQVTILCPSRTCTRSLGIMPSGRCITRDNIQGYGGSLLQLTSMPEGAAGGGYFALLSLLNRSTHQKPPPPQYWW